MQEVYKKNGDFVYRNIAGETLLVPIRKAIKELQSIYTLNETACFIWEKIDGRRRLIEIAHLLSSEYNMDNNSSESDILEFVIKLKDIGAVQCIR
mgnify:CR=1 FL=1